MAENEGLALAKFRGDGAWTGSAANFIRPPAIRGAAALVSANEASTDEHLFSYWNECRMKSFVIGTLDGSPLVVVWSRKVDDCVWLFKSSTTKGSIKTGSKKEVL
ncbi:hypothetical protein EVAR_99325_1 [Eumeta japonica]|uniref:Uncharacterized protein n=1 Tax=Eumeta variegata TaxID=151549 RepID=A0A4C1ZRF5_EUMVA|nr:hypothetical protein EVAR_99325_1 [Eumeta japonica]